jgi:hypothetical protein
MAASGAGILGDDAVAEPLATADVGTSASGHESGDDGGGEVATQDVCPACPEPEPTPLPKSEGPRKVKKPRQPHPMPEVAEPSCTDVDAEAQAANEARQWSRVLKLTKSSRCWKDDGKREWLRVRALSQTDRYAECAELGASSRNPEAKRLGKSCATQLEQEKTP